MVGAAQPRRSIRDVVADAQLWLQADRRADDVARTVGLIVGPDVTTAGIEWAAVESLYAVQIGAASSAVADTVRSMFARLDLVHVAAHGTFRSDHPLLSTLRLRDGESTLYDTVPRVQRGWSCCPAVKAAPMVPPTAAKCSGWRQSCWRAAPAPCSLR